MVAHTHKGPGMLHDSVFEAAYSEIARIKWPELSTAFFNKSNSNQEFMKGDLARSGLDPLHIGGHAPNVPLLKSSSSEGCYIIPYYGLDGNPILSSDGYLAFYRQRMKLPEFSKESRYTQPSAEQLIKHNLPGFLPYFHPLTRRLEGDTIYCAEGEKKTVSVLRYLGQPAFGIGGCQMWRDPNKSGGLHPWIRALLKERGFKKIVIIPDGDLFRYDICHAYGSFANLLRDEGCAVEIIDSGGKIDDLFLEWGSDAAGKFAELRRITPDELVQNSSQLAGKYHLSFRKTKNDEVIVDQNTANIPRLLENHPGFEKFWLNADTNKIYMGEEELTPQRSELEITNYIQYNLGMSKVAINSVMSCVAGIAKKNERSPFFDWVRSRQWDGVPRLDTWLTRLWGVEDSKFSRQLGMKFLVGACARMDKPGTKVDWMMITIGSQGTGKSSMPKVLFKEHDAVVYGDYTDKDFLLKAHGSLVIGFDELDSFGKKDMAFLKAMISNCVDNFRPPYGRTDEAHRRRFMIYGSGNNRDFLPADHSGYRRYPIINVKKKLDFEGLKAELDQLWGEAWHRYTTEDIDVSQVNGASEVAEGYVTSSTLGEQLVAALEMRAKMNNEGPFTLNEILKLAGNEKALPKEASSVLRQLGYEPKQVRRASGVVREWTKKA